MSRKNMILLGVLAGGLLFCGIGWGILFAEFSNLSYGGTVMLSADASELTTEKQCVTLSLQAKNKTHLQTGFDGTKTAKVIADDSLPVGQVCYQITYTSNLVHPQIIHVGEDTDEQNPYVFVDYRHTDTLQVFMMLKDEVLEDLKEKKISSYQVTYVQDMKVFMHPDTMQYVRITEGY